MTTPLRRLLAAYREAVKLHDSNHDDAYTGPAKNAIIEAERAEQRLQNLVAERNAHAAALRGLVAWVDAMGVVRFPSFAGMNVQPLLDARELVKPAARGCHTCAHQARPVCSGCGIRWAYPSWEPKDVRRVAVDVGGND